MAEFPVGNDRDNLRLVSINENGTISEMIKTIDENFKNIAAHGGGPDGLPGMDGINGADGTSAEYIFALCDEEPKEGTDYPATDSAKNSLFEDVEFTGKGVQCGNVVWFDHPQGVSKDHKNEYVFSRYVVKVNGETKEWKPADKPVLWSHWGETGKDGDGVEYIFMRSKTKLDENTLEDSIIKKKSMSGDKYQSVIYQMDDFFPGEEWFKDDKNKTNVWKAINAKYGEVPSDFETLWSNRFNMIVPDYDWTDEPKGTDPVYVYEYVAIRRCNVDDEDRKEWGDFSIPAIWSHYGLSTRTIIIYCNIEDTVSPLSPQSGEGSLTESNGKFTLILPDSLVKAGWKDTNETPSENQITWMCSGIFDNSGENVSWSKPMRITGKDGKQGEDGTTVEFIYALSKDMPAHPTIERETTDSKPGAINTKEELFDAAKNANTEYNGQVWYDRAQPISPDKPTEYVWSRRRDKESEPWEYDDEPIIWAHWGEDGTDGDGVEYIFTRTLKQVAPSAPVKYNTLTNDQKKIFQIDDFVPSTEWFGKKKSRTNAQKVLGREITDAEWNNYFGFDVTTVIWYDNPKEVSALSPFQWVSIRRSHTDETTGGKRFWEDFSDPVLWNSYGKSTRTFIVYCNVSDGVLPPTLRTPVGGFWNVSTGELVKDEKNLETPYTYDALASGVTVTDRENHINIWEDNNKDVDDKIAWMSSAIFGDDGKIIGEWSAPFRITGHNGENGADGSNIEYIYALCDDEDSLKYPQNDTDPNKNTFFNNVENAGTNGYKYENTTTWYDHPQGVSNENGKRTEWVWSRSKPAGDSKTAQWKYAPSAVKWSHWGEDGTDGDGVEYIFYVTNDKDFNTPPIQQSAINTSTQNGKYQKALFQVDDFYPGTGFFKTGDNKKRDRVKNEISSKVNGFDETYFNNQWASANPFGLASNWTDNPTGTGPTSQYEFVSIRRFTTEDVSGKKTWGEFGKPKLWSSFSIRTRVFIVYCNIPRDITAQVQTPTGGYWNVTEDKLQNDSTGGTYSCNALTDSAMPNPNPSRTCVWSDTDQDVSNTITWMATGIFYEDNTTPKWSEPHRITGEDGQRGTDGSNMEFIYAISESMEAGTNYPTKDKDDTNPNNENTKEWLFDHVENDDTFDPENGDPKGYAYGDTFWYDRAQPIENVAGKRTEYAWSRYRSAGATEWTYDPKPFVWAHWGEDGTDGDGVEYIFMLRDTPLDGKYKTDWDSTWTDGMALLNNDNGKAIIKAIYSIDDFIPDSKWFYDNHNTIDTRARQILAANGIPVSDEYSRLLTHAKNLFSFDNKIQNVRESLGKWYDNPQELTPSNRYQYVSIRKMNNGEWGDFSYPKLWSKYNISSFTEFAFTATTPDVDLSNYLPTGGTFSNPRPISDYNNLRLVWSDGPKPDLTKGKTIIWMTSAKFEEDKNATESPIWSACQRMADTSTFQVEWSTDDISGNELTNKISKLADAKYNFGKFLSLPEVGYDPDKAEKAWRKAVKEDTNLGLTFGDTSGDAVLMATCQEKNGVWTNWKIDRVKGEKGDNGKPGADGSNIEFVYALTDDIPQYPKEAEDTLKRKFFDSIERAKEKDFSDSTQNTDPNIDWDNILYNNEEKVAFYRYYPNKSDNPNVYTDWYDSPQGIQDVKGKRSEWVWSRNKAAGNTSANWTYANTASIWSHWGEDGTDGDGVEYIFIVKNVESYPDDTTSKSNWNNHWTVFTDANASVTAKAIYAMDDFCPSEGWFNNNNNKDNVKNSMENPSKDFDESVWNTIKTNMSGLGNWTDNPENISATNKYQYVSIRKTVDGKWGPFSYPKLWSKYNTSKFTSFVFAATTIGISLDDTSLYGVKGGSFNNPYPTTYKKNGNTWEVDESITWTDTPQPDVTNHKTEIWMTSAQIVEGSSLAPSWAPVTRMKDTYDFQIEWSSDNLTPSEISLLNKELQDNPSFNFYNILTNDANYNHNEAEKIWRKRVNDFTKNKPNEFPTVPGGVIFGDDSADSVLMATCEHTNNSWTNWVVKNIKGEQGPQGEPGTSIDVQTKITHEVYFGEDTGSITADSTYNRANATTAMRAAVTNKHITGNTGELLIVYPKRNNDGSTYIGETPGDILYMWIYQDNQWKDYNDPTYKENGSSISVLDENIVKRGYTAQSPNKHLILWDGDSWKDLGELVGPAGESWVIRAGYAIDDPNGVGKKMLQGDDIINAKYIGTLSYLGTKDVTEYLSNANKVSTDPDIVGWNWSLFKGQDGFGYEYIFKATAANTPASSIPDIPTGDWNSTPNVVPIDLGWADEPMEPTKDLKYVWMCWRKYDHSTQKWTNFKGNGDTNKARLWQVYANSINEVKEYFHADTSISPNDKLFDTISATQLPDNWNTFWHTKSEVIGTNATDDYKWSSNKAYLFNREVITYTDGTVCILDSHFVATYADKIKDVDDFYILEPAKGTNNDNDPGEHAPCYDAKTGKPTKISGNSQENAGIDYWTNGQPPKINEQYPILWNITQRVYEDIDTGTKTNRVDWSAPIVIGVYGQGANGEDSIYVDLSNEMDSIQIKYDSKTKNYKTITSRTCETEIRLYKGSKLMKIKDIDISGEDNVQNLHGITVTRQYYVEDKVEDKEVTSNVPSTGFDYAKITFKVPNNAEFNNTSYKIVFTVTAVEKVSPNNNIIRMTSYNLVGTTHPVVYSIVPSKSEIIYKKSGENYICEPSNITIEVKEYVGSEISSYDKYNESQAFGLYYDWNDSGNPTRMDSPTAFSISTSGKQPGDYVTFTIAVDADSNSNTGTNGFETVLDRETVYVLREGSDGQQGVSGNGYQYKYVQYVNASNEWYGGSICSIAGPKDVDNPTFKIGEMDITSTVTSEPHGVDASHMYEWRSERFGYPSTATTSSSWSSWSDPIIIAKYFDDSNLSTMISTTIEQQKASIAQTVKGELSTELDRLNELSGYFDASGYLQCSGIQSSILSGYVTRDSLSNDVLSIGLTGVSTDSSGVITFADWIDYQHKTLATAGQSINAINGTIETFATKTELSNVTTAMDTFKADAHDKFAQMDRTVANAQFMTDAEGYLMVDIPDYSIWFNTTTELSGKYKDTDIRNDVTWVLASILEGSDGSDSDSEIDETTIRTSNTLVPYIIPESKLYNTNTDTVVFVLKTVIPNFNIITQLDEIKTLIDREIIVTLNKLTGKYAIYVDSGSESESESDISILAGIYTYDEKIPGYSPTDVLVIMYATTDVSNGGENGIFSNLTWTVGVAEGEIGVSAGQGGGITSFSYVNTASLFNGPIFPHYGVKEQNVERVKHMTSLNKQYGYSVTRNTDTNNENYNKYGELNTNGKLSITNGEGCDYILIPEGEGVKDIMDFLNGKSEELISAIKNDDEIGVDETRTYYVATKCTTSESDFIDCPYTISLPGDNKVEFKSYNEPIFKNKHIFIKTDNENGFVDTNNGYRQKTTTGVSNDYYDIYITSKYDEIKLTYAYSITPGLPPEDNGNPSESVPLDNHARLKLVYWYDNNPEPTDGGDITNSVEIFNISSPSGIQTGNRNVSIFENIDLQKDKCLHMKVYAYCGNSLTGVDIKYKIETSNRITYDNALDIGVIMSRNVTACNNPYDPNENCPQSDKLKILGIYEDPNNTEGVEATFNQYIYWFDQNHPTNQISTISVTTFTSYVKDIDIRLKFELNLKEGDTINNQLHYMVIPGSYDVQKVQTLLTNFDKYSSDTKTDYFTTSVSNGGFLESEEFNTVGINKWNKIEPTSTSASIDLNFADVLAVLDKDSGLYTYSYTIIQYYPYDKNNFSFKSVMTADVISEMPWDTNNGYSRSPYDSNLKYLIDRITVTVKDRERTGEIPTTKRKAKDKNYDNNPGVKNYIEVLDTEKPYLITNVSELATISQMVSDGIACTSIMTKSGDSTSVFYAQAVDGGESQIYMRADEVGIKSNYLTLNKKGLTLTGNLYAKNTDKYITAGIIGDSSSIGDGVKFFAGINNLPSTSSDSEIKNAVQKAKFYVTESGHLHAEDVDISGNITANNFSASDTYIIDKDKPTQYSFKKTSIMNADRFEVTSEFSQDGSTQIAKIYISVEPEIAVGSGDLSENGTVKKLTNVPTLCMQYGGKNYYLTPDMWKSFDPKTYYDVKMVVSDSYYEIYVTDFTGEFYVQWELWVEEIGNTDNKWTIELNGTTTQYNKPSQFINGPFASTVGANNTIPSSLLGKTVKVCLVLVTPFSDSNFSGGIPIATQEGISIPYKNDTAETTIPVKGWKFTFNETAPGTRTGVWSIT